jgi:hypothetical protein
MLDAHPQFRFAPLGATRERTAQQLAVVVSSLVAMSRKQRRLRLGTHGGEVNPSYFLRVALRGNQLL